MQKPIPFLWFNNQAEEAANLYVSVIKNSRIQNISRYGEGGPQPAGTAMIVSFELNGQQVMAMNGGPEYKFTEAFSFFINCDSQDEVDELWEKLSEGGEKGPCGWLKDKFGLSWQIVPTILGELMGGPDPARSQRVMQALLQMSKLDIAGLKRAYELD